MEPVPQLTFPDDSVLWKREHLASSSGICTHVHRLKLVIQKQTNKTKSNQCCVLASRTLWPSFYFVFILYLPLILTGTPRMMLTSVVKTGTFVSLWVLDEVLSVFSYLVQCQLWHCCLRYFLCWVVVVFLFPVLGEFCLPWKNVFYQISRKILPRSISV